MLIKASNQLLRTYPLKQEELINNEHSVRHSPPLEGLGRSSPSSAQAPPMASQYLAVAAMFVRVKTHATTDCAPLLYWKRQRRVLSLTAVLTFANRCCHNLSVRLMVY